MRGMHAGGVIQFVPSRCSALQSHGKSLISRRPSMPLRPITRVLLCLSLLLGAAPSCNRLKKKAPEEPKPGAVPEIVDEPAEAVPPPAPPPVDPAVPALVVNKSAQVGILGYHQFTTGKSTGQMVLNIDRFREEMQALKDARVAVVPMKDFLAWRRGEKPIPDPCVIITVDDGYRSTYELAFPVLKEYGYPFTLFLYKRFVNGGGKSLRTAEIKEMMAAGAEVGSHSVSHPYKRAIDARFRSSQTDGEAFLRMEMKDSKQFLEDLLGVSVPTYAYPGGFFSPREQEIGKEAGYEAMFTVNPTKATWDTPAESIGRYIVLGNDPNDANFKRAISSRGTAEGDLVKQLLGGEGDSEPLVTTKPLPNAQVASRRPLIEVDVSKLEGIDPASIVMKIAGFGLVPARFDPAEKKIRYHVGETLRSSECQVSVTFKRASEPKPDQVSWRFFIDLVAHYLPDEPDKLEKATVVEEPEVPESADPAVETPPPPQPVHSTPPKNARPKPKSKPAKPKQS
jgi:peptidoglycan/xylan/chitin deacetylase (PgdA/CDA1 family)